MRENKITKMMAVVLGAYSICYIPQMVMLIALRSVRNPPLWLAMAERVSGMKLKSKLPLFEEE